MKGIDVSQHNGNIDWNKVKPNIDFAILRLGWIGNHANHTMDTRFEHYYSECKRLGIPVGIYVYNYAVNTEAARSGARWTLKKLQGKKIQLPIYIDMEDPSGAGLGKNLNTNIAIAFNEIIEKEGIKAGVYASRDWFDNKLNKDEIKKRYTTWIAHYGVSKDKYKGQYDMLQYTSKGKVNGIGGNVDLNEMYKDLIKNSTNTKPEKPKPAKKSTEELAKEVIDGKWGTGADRKKKLEEAGYNYQEVQNRVNQILGSQSKPLYYPEVNKKYSSLVDALESIKVDSSFEHRKKIAAKNNVNNYKGTMLQNKRLLDKLKAGRLLKA